MKLRKEDIEKLVLGAILFIALIYCYFVLLLGPLQTRQHRTRAMINELGPKITQAKGQIRRTQEMEVTAPAAALTVKQLSAMIPDGSPVAWFPTSIAEFFKRHGLDKAATRMNAETPEKALTGFRSMSWGVELPKAELVAFGQALASFENEELLAEVTGLVVEPTQEDIETQRISLTVTNLVRK